jgi:large subunit ribosomal protein L19
MNQATILEKVEANYQKSEVPHFEVGDTVDVHCRIIEGNKERIQVFSGICIAKKGRGLGETFTIRRIVAHEGVERVFPVHSPNISQIEVRRHGNARRSKLDYLRQRVGKGRRRPDRRRGLKHLTGTPNRPGKPAYRVDKE